MFNTYPYESIMRALNEATAARIVKRVSGVLLVELEDKTLYFNAAGI